jgi:hypothetical protein
MKERGKTIYISKTTHALVKNHCDKYGFIMQAWIDNILREKLKELKR